MMNWHKKLKRRFFFNGLKVIQVLCLGIVLSSRIYASTAIEAFTASSIKIHLGDSLQWRFADYDDSQWRAFDSEQSYVAESEKLWLRWQVKANEEGIRSSEVALFFMLTATYEIYWNGVYIGNNCMEGNNIHALNGRFFQRFHLPDSAKVLPENTVAVRAAVQPQQEILIIQNETGLHDVLLEDWYSASVPKIVFLIIYLILGIYYLVVLFFLSSERKIATAIFAILMFQLALHFGLNLSFMLMELHADHFPILAEIDVINLLLTHFAIPIFFCYKFESPYKKRILTASLVSFLVIYFAGAAHFDPYLVFIVALLSAPVIIWALSRRLSGSLIALSGVVFLLIVDIMRSSIPYSYDVFMLVFILLMNISLAKQIASQRQEYQHAILHLSRLKTELLQKYIQPHFLINSLNAAIEWLQTEPQKGIEFINSLSDELRILSRISDKRLITIEEELRICRAHLKIMSYRRKIDYHLQTEGIDPAEKIPPAIFHTMVENGITHSTAPKKRMKFILKRQNGVKSIRYILFNECKAGQNGKPCAEAHANGQFEEGTGYKYIKARLRESYGALWHLSYGPVNGGWQTIVEIPQ